MKRWAVSYIGFADNDLTTLIVRADDWASALKQHPGIESSGLEFDWSNLELVKEEAFNCDCMVECVEIVN